MSEHLTSAAHRADVTKRAQETFAQHELSTVCDTGDVKVWRCARPGTGIHHFYVSILPGAILVHGDIGQLLLDRVYARGLGWIRNSAHSLEYLLSKSSYMKKADFMPGDALDVLACPDEYGYAEETVAKIRAAWEPGDDGDAWDEAVYDVTGDCDFPRCRDYSFSTLWCVEALRWFVRAYEVTIDHAAEVVRG